MARRYSDYLKIGISGGRDMLREKVRERDNWTCQSCGKKWVKGQRRLDVHHLDTKFESWNGREYGKNKDPKDMITLCHRCHLNLPHIRLKMSLGIRKSYKKVASEKKSN